MGGKSSSGSAGRNGPVNASQSAPVAYYRIPASASAFDLVGEQVHSTTTGAVYRVASVNQNTGKARLILDEARRDVAAVKDVTDAQLKRTYRTTRQ